MDESIYMLIAARLHGETLSGEEERRLATWLEESPAHRELYDYYGSLRDACVRLRAWDRSRPPRDFVERLARGGTRRVPRWRRWGRYAAVLVPLLALTAVLWTWRGEDGTMEPRDVAPGSSRAVLKRASGPSLELAGAGLLIARGTPLPGEAAGTLAYRDAGDLPVEEHRLEVRRGGEYKVELPDGSRAWLNSESTLVYPSRFTGKERRVRLEGEGYFEVQPDAGAPFIVTVDGCDARVLGTTFNVSRYAGDRHVVITLVSGSVEVSAGGTVERLSPGQQCAYDLVEGGMTLREVDATRYISWTNSLFVFDDIPVEELARQISRWYDVEVRFADDAVRAASFTGAMERYRPASYIVRMLNETNTVECSLDEHRVLTFHAPR
ncbi:MAG: FecR domain-containing protein [Odoribacteraceae bacterium]|jgi:ferric-dicitrate binding protein FerR (iron transport regulator)|nr:FecR domain-containing protein [Odoribacteraceae bacterium]